MQLEKKWLSYPEDIVSHSLSLWCELRRPLELERFLNRHIFSSGSWGGFALRLRHNLLLDKLLLSSAEVGTVGSESKNPFQ